jgi:YVTN family beta-propeller protein
MAVLSRSGLLAAALVTVVVVAVGIAAAAVVEEGRIGPDSRIQPSGRKLDPVGRLTLLGNHPGGGALTTNGRFLWTLSAGRGKNDIRIVRVAHGRRGRVVQIIPMPGVDGGIAMAADGRTAYVSGTAESGHADQKVGADVPGKQGDVIHVFRYDPISGLAARDGVINVPPPAAAPAEQSFPPTSQKGSWPRDLAVAPDGRTLLAALNLADHAAVVDTSSRTVRYVPTGHYPYGAAVTPDGKRGLVSNESDGTVSVIDLPSATKIKDIQVGPHLSHPEGIAIDPAGQRAFVAVTHQDVVAVIDLQRLEVERTLSVGRPLGIGTSPVAVSVTRDGRRLLVTDSGEDAVAVFALPAGGVERRSAAARRAERILAREGGQGAALAQSADEDSTAAARRRTPIRRRPRAFELLGRIPTASYPVVAEATPDRRTLTWVAAKGLGVGPNPNGPNPLSPNDSDDAINRFQYLPSIVTGAAGVASFPSNARLRRLSLRVSREIRPVNGQAPPPGTPIRPPGPSRAIKHVFYIVRENRTYDQVLGDDPRGDGDPKLTLFGQHLTPNAHALARRFPLLDHVYANSEASIDGHFWTAAGAVSDYVIKNWHQNYGDRKRPYDFGVYAVTWPSRRFLFDQAEKQGISWFNFGEAVAGNVTLFPDKDRGPAEAQEQALKSAKSDIGPPTTGCFTVVAFSGGTNGLTGKEVFDSSLPPGAPAGSESRFDCFKRKFTFMAAAGAVPAFTYITLPNDHTAGTRPGARTPTAMVAENDYALGQIVDTISHSPAWNSSLILVVEDDSQDGADHVDAHRIPALAISPYTRRGAVVHTRYDFLSVIRTLEIAVGMKPLNLFDSVAVPMYNAFSPEPSNAEPYSVIPPNVNLTERNPPNAAAAKLSRGLPLNTPDLVPQRVLDKILWKSIHGANSTPPPPGPNASGEEKGWRPSRRR